MPSKLSDLLNQPPSTLFPVRPPLQALEPDQDTLARTAWGEGRGEGLEGMQAVLNVLMNRVGQPGFPSSPSGVALQPNQFSAWSPSDPNRQQMLQTGMHDPSFIQAAGLAKKALGGKLPDITGGATHYTGPGAKENWSKTMQLSTAVGKHRFFKKQSSRPKPKEEEEVGPRIEALGLTPPPSSGTLP